MSGQRSERSAAARRLGPVSAGIFGLVFVVWSDSRATETIADQGMAELTEIIVTAQRREESLKTVPISVQALTAEQLNEASAVDTKSLTDLLPTLNFAEGSSIGASGFALRGVQSIAQQGGIQPSTALVIDGVPVMRQAEFISDLVDIDRVELLNGPQGTLFGKNSTAGVINIVQKRPSDKLEGNLAAGATSDGEYSIRGMLNVPISDRVELRTNAFYRDQEPIIKNVYPGVPDVDGAKSWGVQQKLNVSLSGNASLLLSAGYSSLNSSYLDFIPLLPGEFPNFALVRGIPLGRGLTPMANNDSPSLDELRTWHGSAEINWDFSDSLSLISVTSYRHMHEDNEGDFDGLPVGGNIGRGLSPNPYHYPVSSYNAGLPRAPDTEGYWSEEARLNYKSGPVNAITGVFYQTAMDNFVSGPPYLLDGSIVRGIPGTTYYSVTDRKILIHDKTASLFGDVTYAFSDQIRAFTGLRYTHESFDTSLSAKTYFTAVGAGFNAVTAALTAAPIATLDFLDSRSYNNISGRAGLQWQPTQDLNYYASYSHGYKGPAAGTAATSAAQGIVNPEIANSYEIGAKLRFLDNRVALDMDVFYESIVGIQEDVVPPGMTLTNQLINAGTLITRGVESTFQVAATKNIKFDGGLVYDHADYHNFRFACNSAQTRGTGGCAADGTQDISGQQAISSPKWKGIFNSTYSDKLPSIPYNYYLNVGFVWVSSIQYLIGDDPLTREPSHGLLSASAGLKSNDGHWELQLYGKNLTNHLYYNSLYSAPFLSNQFAWLSRDFARYGGVNLKYSF
jgi:iron complex outermembrane receptor protein